MYNLQKGDLTCPHTSDELSVAISLYLFFLVFYSWGVTPGHLKTPNDKRQCNHLKLFQSVGLFSSNGWIVNLRYQTDKFSSQACLYLYWFNRDIKFALLQVSSPELCLSVVCYNFWFKKVSEKVVWSFLRMRTLQTFRDTTRSIYSKVLELHAIIAANNKRSNNPFKITLVLVSRLLVSLSIVRMVWNGLTWDCLLAYKSWRREIFPTENLYLIEIMIMNVI